MSYELRSGEGLGEGIRRICRKQIALAIEASEASRRDDDSPVHRTRKHLKKARAALRLLERATPRCEFKIAWRALRAARDLRHSRRGGTLSDNPASRRTVAHRKGRSDRARGSIPRSGVGELSRGLFGLERRGGAAPNDCRHAHERLAGRKIDLQRCASHRAADLPPRTRDVARSAASSEQR